MIKVITVSKGGCWIGKKKGTQRFYDYSLLFTVVFLTTFGLIMIYSASSYRAQISNQYGGNATYFMSRQAMTILIDFLIMLFISKLDYHWYPRFAVLAYIMSFVLTVTVSLMGKKMNGKRRWLVIGGIQFQLAELVKITLIVVLATVVTILGSRINEWRAMLLVIGLTIPITGLAAANNLSSGIIICGITFVMLFISAKRELPFAICMGVGIAGIASVRPIGHVLKAMGILQSHQLSRINVWLDPEAYPKTGDFQVLQGLYAIGSGGLSGKGLGENIQKLDFVPEAQNDMIFSIIYEGPGLFGAISVILIFMSMTYRFMLIASNAPDLFDALLMVEMMSHVTTQVILNITVVTNTIPDTGVTFPFISYGGISTLFLIIEMRMVLSVSSQVKLEK